MKVVRHSLLALVVLALIGCGGGQTSTLPDETGDLDIGTGGSGFSAAGTRPGGPDLDGTQWRWVEAHCTEGPLDLSARGFAQELRVSSDSEGLLLTYDQVFEAEECTQTVVQRARPTEDAREMTLVEEVRIAQPPTPECQGRMEDERPGEVRHNGEFLEVLVQRSRVWCNGLEVRMVYAPSQGTPLSPDQIVRRYAAHFNRRDAASVAALFAENGSLVEPFNVTATGGQSRHDGREDVERWYRETFAGVDWLAFKLESVTAGAQDGQFVTDWQYMDPRTEQPFRGRNHFTIAVGEIYESRIELTEPPADAEGPEGDGPG